MRQVICPYCKNQAKLVRGNEVYPHLPDLASKFFWKCAPCDAYVGCHMPSRWTEFQQDVPLGRLANSPLRRLKSEAHKAFDPLWKNGSMSRREAYQWLAKQLGLPFEKTHIGEFDEKMCMKVCTIMRTSFPT